MRILIIEYICGMDVTNKLCKAVLVKIYDN